jgi:alkanesulfonate monooxygenase SsuD/methylene tetrahydromethanopterin reductase-like flavin-dependent oxidoreductase (luciferase family)
MHLTASLSASGYHPASWRVSGAPDEPSAAHFQALARTAERGKLDAVLIGQPAAGLALRASGYVNRLQLDPLPLMASLIGVTRRIGLGAAWSVDFTEPYNIARVFATLDHLAGGRTAWIARMLGGPEIAAFFAHARGPADSEAYSRRTVEFIGVVKRLWDSWEDEAFIVDKRTGMFADPAKVHPLHHDGEFFTIRGPLNVPRPVQGNPVIVQNDLAALRRITAATADVVLVSAGSPAEAKAISDQLRALAAQHLRPPNSLRILVNVAPLLRSTEAEASRRAAELADAIEPSFSALLARERQSRELAGTEAPVDIDEERRRAAASAGLPFIGTPEQLVASLGAWERAGACDGFNILPPVLPDDLDIFVDEVVPLMQRRDLARKEYRGDLLRDHLGLDRPRSRYGSSPEGVRI